MAKPASKIDWTQGEASKVTEPTASKKLLGWIADERPSFKFMNFNFFNLNEWIIYLEGVTDGLIALQSTYDVVVGSGGTHATLQDAIDDAGLGEDVRVLITDPFTITTTIVVSKNGWFIEWKPNAIYAQGLTNTPGIQVTAERITLINGRMIDFDGGTDVAIELEAGSKNCIVNKMRFNNVDTDIQDDGTNNILSDNLNEV